MGENSGSLGFVLCLRDGFQRGDAGFNIVDGGAVPSSARIADHLLQARLSSAGVMALSASSGSVACVIKLEDFWGAQKVGCRGLHLPVNGFGELCERGSPRLGRG